MQEGDCLSNLLPICVPCVYMQFNLNAALPWGKQDRCLETVMRRCCLRHYGPRTYLLTREPPSHRSLEVV